MPEAPTATLLEPPPQGAAGVEIRDVSLSYGSTPVLKDITLTVEPGEFFAFLGPSGCGKTTLLRLIAGFNSAQSGHVRIGGEDVSGLPPWKRGVGMVFQSYALWPHMSVARNVAFGLEERRIPRREIAVRIDEALALVGLQHLKDRKPSQLSGGQQQRVALARTIAIRPKVLLLDEPLSNLDAKMRVQVRRELRELQQKLGITTIFVTHDQEEANTVCDRIAVMHDGAVKQVGTPIELYDRPASLVVAGFLGAANILDGRADGQAGVFHSAGGGILPLDRAHRVAPGAKALFRPQNAVIRRTDDIPAAGQLRLTGVVLRHEFLGPTIRYTIRVGSNEVLADVAHQGGEVPFASSAPVGLDLDCNCVLFLAD
jgi:iron(III) transport system ATP-binding protein